MSAEETSKIKLASFWKKQMGKFNQSMSGAFLFIPNTFFLFRWRGKNIFK